MNEMQWVEEETRKLNKEINRFTFACESVAQEEERFKKAEQAVAHALQAQEHLQLLAQTVQQKSHQQISAIMSRCLSAVFDDPYQMKIDFVRLRGKTEARLYYLRDGHEVDPRQTSGGVLDLSSLAGRITKIMLSDPQPRKFLVLDEPLKGISSTNLPRAAALLQSLASEMGMQFLLITHNDELASFGKIYNF